MSENTKEALSLVLIELEKAKKKHPAFPYAYNSQCSIIGEEYGGVCKAVNDFMSCVEGATRENILLEAAHVAVTSIRMIEQLIDQKKKDGEEW